MLARLLTAVVAAGTIAIFSGHEVVHFQLKAPLNELFDNARTDDDYSVDGTLSYTDKGRPVTVENVTVTLRGHTSRRQTECTFPKLKVSFPDGAAAHDSLFAGMDAIKLGTHCGEAPEDAVSMKYGRLPNELSPHREAFVYRLLAALNVTTLQARPARVTYIYTDPKPGEAPPQDQPIVRNAMIIEDDKDAVARLGGHGEIAEEEFTNARAMFTPADTAAVALAEALTGNFDWCLKMTPDDRYRCDARHPLWNITAAKTSDGRARPIIHDFDVSGMVAGRHPWFKSVFPESFGSARSDTEIEVLAQVQRTRSLFSRSDLNAARARFIARKGDAYRTLDEATLDRLGKAHARRYLDAFYNAIESDQAFYRPVVAVAGAMPLATADGGPACQSGGAIPPGTPVSEPLQTNGEMIHVQLLDALWHWAPPARCDAIRKGPVWIKADVVSTDYPKP